MKIKGLLISVILLTIVFGDGVAAQKETPETVSNLRQERKMEADGIVAVRNDFGDITVTGWDSDKVEASAIVRDTQKPLAVSLAESLSSDGKKVLSIVPKGSSYNETGYVILQVKVPRGVKLEPLKTDPGSLTISNIEGLVVAQTDKGNINISESGSVSAQSKSGSISAENIKNSLTVRADADAENSSSSRINLRNIGGNVEITTGDGTIMAQNIGGDVRLISVSSPKIDFRCVKGRIDISDAFSLISLTAVDGDIEAANSTGEIRYTGEIQAGKRYHMKTLTGVVSMLIPRTSGFTATLRSYSGSIKSAFSLQKDPTALPDKKDKELSGTFGNGQSRIELDSFSGEAEIREMPSGFLVKCGK